MGVNPKVIVSAATKRMQVSTQYLKAEICTIFFNTQSLIFGFLDTISVLICWYSCAKRVPVAAN